MSDCMYSYYILLYYLYLHIRALTTADECPPDSPAESGRPAGLRRRTRRTPPDIRPPRTISADKLCPPESGGLRRGLRRSPPKLAGTPDSAWRIFQSAADSAGLCPPDSAGLRRTTADSGGRHPPDSAGLRRATSAGNARRATSAGQRPPNAI